MPGRRCHRGERRHSHGGMFFLHACLLVLLHRQAGYGYSLLDDLREFGFSPENIDISIIYRALRNLQADGLVSDAWDDNSLGPPRRVYRITPQGEACLSEWMRELRQTLQGIEALEAAYAAVKDKTGTQ